MNFEQLYSNITGELLDSDANLNVFTSNSKCSQLSKRAFEIKQNINARLLSEDDDELSEMMDILNDISKEIAKQVYEHCCKQGAQ